MSPIRELTAAQEQKLEAYRDKWLKIGLSTEPVNKEDAERALKETKGTVPSGDRARGRGG